MGTNVSLFITCIVDQFYPKVGQSMVAVLERCGCKVDFPMSQTCCGQPALNSGFHEEAKAVARTWIRAFRDSEYVVAPSGSCVSLVREHYPLLFPEGTPEHDDAVRLSKITFEFTEFLVSGLGIEDIGAQFQHAVGYHESCHLLRSLHVSEQPKSLLQHVRGLELKPLEAAQECCGFGGTFSVKLGDLSASMADEKLAAIQRTGVNTVVGCDMSCLMHMDGRARRLHLPIDFKHIAEILAERS